MPATADPEADPVTQLGGRSSTARLRGALRANAVFSLVSGLAAAGGGWWLAAGWGVPWRWLIPAVGAGLMLFAGFVSWVAVQPASRLRWLARLVTGADAAWVLGSATLIGAGALTFGARLAIGALALIVAGFGVWQAAGLRSASRGDALAGWESFERTQTVPASMEQAWALIADHDLYGRIAPNLSSVVVISDPGEPLRRRCTAASGGSWEESCTVWEPGRRYAVEVDTTNYPYPLAAMRGLWQTEPGAQAGTVRITVRFAYRFEPTLRGGMFALAFVPLFGPVVVRIYRGWRRSLAGG